MIKITIMTIIIMTPITKYHFIIISLHPPLPHSHPAAATHPHSPTRAANQQNSRKGKRGGANDVYPISRCKEQLGRSYSITHSG